METLEHDEKLKYLTGLVIEAADYFKENCNIFHKTRNFVFISNIDKENQIILDELGQPSLEFNVVRPHLLRTLGEFENQTISFYVRSNKNNKNESDLERCKLIGGHLNYLFNSFDQKYEVIKDVLTGGFSAIKVYVEYENEKSFSLRPKIVKANNPTLVLFDPKAKKKSKEDANYYFEFIPLTYKSFLNEYDDEEATSFEIDNYSISNYKNNNNNKDVEKMILIVHFYLKEYVKTTIYYLDDGSVKTKDEYKELLKSHKIGKLGGKMPEILKKRKTELKVINRYEICGNKILRVKKTDFKRNSFVFCDGDSIDTVIESENNIEEKQVVCPMLKDTINAQMMMNRGGQLLMDYFDKIVRGKYIMPIEAVPEHIDARTYNLQTQDTVFYNQYKDDKPVQMPSLMQNPPIPPEIIQMFSIMPQTIQHTLGSYNAQMGINETQISGKAILNGATQTNATVLPYVNNILHAYTQLGYLMLDLIPKFYKDLNNLIYLDEKGSKNYHDLSNSDILNYKSDEYEIEVKAVFNFELQKSNAMESMIRISQTLPNLAKLLNEKALPNVIDNFKFDGADQLKLMAEDLINEIEQQKQMMQGKPQPEPPEIQIEKQKLINEQIKNQILAQKVQNDREISDKKIQLDLIKDTNKDQREKERLKTEIEVNKMKDHIDNKEFNNKVRNDNLNHIKEISKILNYNKNDNIPVNPINDYNTVDDLSDQQNTG